MTIVVTAEDKDGIHLVHIVHKRHNLLAKRIRDDHEDVFIDYISAEIDRVLSICEDVGSIDRAMKMFDSISPVIAALIDGVI